MQVVILAGGLGTRLRPLTTQMPKVLLPVKDKPFIVHLLAMLRDNGLGNILLCIGYLGEQVRDYLGNGRKFGVKLQYSQEREQLLGTAGALKPAKDLLDDFFFVVNGDTYLPIDYKEVERVFYRSQKRGLMVVYNNKEDTGVINSIAVNDAFLITKYDKTGKSNGLKYVDAGVLVFRKDVLNLIPDKYPVSMEASVYPALIKEVEFLAYITEQRFFDIGAPERLKDFEEFLAQR